MHRPDATDAVEDELGAGSTQATVDAADHGRDAPFWDALTAHVPNLHAVISGHGERVSALRAILG